MTMDWESLIEQQPALQVIPGMLREAAVLRHYAAGETLYHRGDRPRAVLCVLDGEIRLVRHSPGGADIIMQRSRAGFIAEASMETPTYHCDVIAPESSRLLAFPLTTFRAALDRDPLFNRAWIAHQARELRRLRAQCERLSLNSAAERILHYLETEGADGTITLTQSRKAWAGELGLSHEVVYRTLRQLRDDGVLEIEGERIALSGNKP